MKTTITLFIFIGLLLGCASTNNTQHYSSSPSQYSSEEQDPAQERMDSHVNDIRDDLDADFRLRSLLR